MEKKLVRDIHIVSNKLCRKSDQIMNNYASSHSRYACTHSQYAVIRYLIKNKNKEIFQKDIEEEFGIRRSSVSAILTHLESKGLIQRESVLKDARLKKISLTNAGEKMVEDNVQIMKNFEQTLLADVTDKELETFYSVLYKLSDAADKI